MILKNINRWFTLVELIIVLAISWVLVSLSFVSLSSIDDSDISNNASEIWDFINNSKINLINFLWDNVDIYINKSTDNFKNRYIYSFVNIKNCELPWWLTSKDFYNDIYLVDIDDNVDYAYFTWSLDPSISILWYKKVWNTFAKINMNNSSYYEHNISEWNEFKYDIYNWDILCWRIFMNKINTKYYIWSIKIQTIKKDIYYDSVMINIDNKFNVKTYLWPSFTKRIFFKWIELTLLSKSKNISFSFNILD